MKLSDILNVKSYWRYFKKGFSALLLLALLGWLLEFPLAWFDATLKGGYSQVGNTQGTALFAFFVASVLVYIISGFVIEYLNKADNKIVRFINK